MIKTLALAGATAALVIGSIAVAQTATGTANNPNTDYNNNQSSMSANNTPNSANAPSATQNGADTSATTGAAGERG